MNGLLVGQTGPAIGHAVFAQEFPKGPSMHSRGMGGMGLVATKFRKHLLKKFAFEFLDRLPFEFPKVVRACQGRYADVLQSKAGAGTLYHRSLNDILQFPDVARPAIGV